MPFPLPAPDSACLRFALVVAGVESPARPGVESNATLTREPAESPSGVAFYYRDTLSPALEFTGTDYALLLGIRQSNNPCQAVGLVLDTRPHPLADWHREYTGTFTVRECTWNFARCSVTAPVVTDDAYRLLLDAMELEYNILATAGDRQQVTATLATLSAGITPQFLRIDSNQEAEYVGTDGWAVFLRNTSFIAGTTGALGIPNPDSTRSRDVLLFRYRLRNVPMTPPVGTATTYTAVDRSGAGWQVLIDSENGGVTPHTIDYVKAPTISGFKPYAISNYGNWNDPDNPAARPLYGDQLLLLPCFESPADHGFSNADYLKVTGSGGSGGGPSMGGAFNAEADGGQCLNVRRNIRQGDTEPANSKSLWWRFGDFRFARAFRLRDGLYELLRATIYGPPVAGVTPAPDPRLLALLPPTADQLGDFLTLATNPATGDTGPANEVPRLHLSAASDVKRYGASEPATRLLISLKKFLDDFCAKYHAGWFIDPATGWFRVEHSCYLETQRAAGDVLDLREAAQPLTDAFRTAVLPRFEELSIAQAQTEDLATNTSFAQGVLDYGTGGCTVGRSGQNRAIRSVSRLTGDVTAAVLFGDAIPDSALLVLAPDANWRLSDANRAVAATSLVRRYHRHGMATQHATVNGLPLEALSVRPERVQDNIVADSCSLAPYAATTRYTTALASGAELGKAVLNLRGGVTLTAWLNEPTYTADAPTPTGRQWSGQFSNQFA